MDLKAEQKKVLFRGVLALIACFIILGISYVLLPRVFLFPDALAERIAFALQVDLFIMFWIVVGVRMVSRGRLRSEADINGSAFGPPSSKIAIKIAFLQNTLEQAVSALGAHLALATLVSGSALSFLVGATVLFAAGRITFYVGYPYGAGGRAFGMVMTMLPTVLGYLWAFYILALRLFGFH